jgi:methyl-accepting chemotaxis protein
MQPWFYQVLALCVVALTVALVLAIVSAARALRRAEQVLNVVEGELARDVPPLLVGLRELTDELRLLGHGANAELDRIGQITGRVQEVTEATAGLLTGLSGLTKVGQLVGIVAGVKAFVNVFFYRLRKPRGGRYE